MRISTRYSCSRGHWYWSKSPSNCSMAVFGQNEDVAIDSGTRSRSADNAMPGNSTTRGICPSPPNSRASHEIHPKVTAIPVMKGCHRQKEFITASLSLPLCQVLLHAGGISLTPFRQSDGLVGWEGRGEIELHQHPFRPDACLATGINMDSLASICIRI